MARIKISLPEKMIFSTDIPVRINDINYGGHLGNDSMVSIIHEARIRFLKEFGFTEFDIGGTGLIMGDIAVTFKKECFYGDILSVSVGVNEFSRVGCDFIYRLSDKKTDEEVARAKTGIVFFDYNQRKSIKVPAVFKEKIESLHQ